MKNYDVIIIGAGPSGSVAAAYLKNQGNSVLVLEKQEFPRFVIGESLLPHCMDHLDEVGLLEAVKSVGFQKKQEQHFTKEILNVNSFLMNNIPKVGNGLGKLKEQILIKC